MISKALPERLPSTPTSVLRPSSVSSVIDHQLGLELGAHRLELLVKWLQRRADMLGLSPSEILHRLFQGDHQTDLATVIALVTNQETSFFRGERQLTFLDTAVIRPLLDGDVRRPIRMWSAACSTGEEALTLGMLVRDYTGRTSVPGVNHPTVEIVASDICPQTLRSAERMRYSRLAETRLGPRRTDRYFTVDGSALVADKSALPQIGFRAHNLIRPIRFGTFDVVVVRNVLFYLSHRARNVALNNIEQSVRPGGVVAFGANDGVLNPKGFEPVGAHCYRRKAAL